jgi:ArsR family transcriptional regulator, arsenate/arsenite/antimonite-responsive transcriptional repressor
MAEQGVLRRAPILAALAQPTRLRILDRVAAAGPDGVAAGELARAIRCPASTLSFHLKELCRTGVLDSRPAGRFVLYALRPSVLRELAFYIARLAGAAAAPGSRRRSAGRRAPSARAAGASQLSMFAD